MVLLGAGCKNSDDVPYVLIAANYPVVAYGYTGHVMDFPGTINNDFECLCRLLATSKSG